MTVSQLQQHLEAAIRHHQAGRLTEADKLYRQVRVAQPNNFDALHLSGVIAYQQARYADAAGLYLRALKANPRSGTCHFRLGLAHAALGNHVQAEQSLRTATGTEPKLVEAWMALAVTLRVLGRSPEAIVCYEKAAELQPNLVEAHDQIGALTSDLKGHAAGMPYFQKAVGIRPDYAPSWCNLGLAYLAVDRIEDALNAFTQAINADPALVQAYVGRGLAYQQSYQIPSAIAEYDAALRIHPHNSEAQSSRLLSLNYLDTLTPKSLADEHKKAGEMLMDRSLATTGGAVRHRKDKLRVAFLSPDLRAHSVAYFLEPLLQHVDRSKYEVILYHDHYRVDSTSMRLREHVVGWRNFVGQLNPTVEATIRQDRPDILVDLAGHTGFNRLSLFGKRLAPLQATYLGYPNTTGLSSMDIRLVDEVSDPGGEDDSHHTEKLVRFSPCAWVYRPPVQSPAAERIGVGPLAFVCFNTPAKLSSSVLNVWRRILDAVPDSILRLKGHGLATSFVRSTIEAKLTSAGIDPRRVELIGRTAELQSHLSHYQTADISLDPFPYNGTTTTCEALWMGVPVVAVRGNRHAGRVSASLLTAIGRMEWIAETEDQYVERAIGLARDVSGRGAFRATARQEMGASVLMDELGQSGRFWSALRAAWDTAG